MTNGPRMVASLLAALIFLSLSATAWAGPPAIPRPQAAPAVITSPQPFTPLRGRVSIFGSAAHPDLWKYEVHFAPEPSAADQWSLIGTVHESPVVDGLLEVWDTTTVPEGAYSLRLRVVRRDGNYEEVFLRQVWVANAQPTETPTPEISPTPTPTETPTPEISPTPTTTPTPLSPTPTLVIELPMISTPTPRPTPTLTPPGGAPAAVSGNEGVWSQPVNISRTARPSWLPRIATDVAGNVHVTWTEPHYPGTNGGSIYYAVWDGSSWSAPVRLTPDYTEPALLSSMGIDSHGVIHVVFAGRWGQPDWRLYYTSAHAGQPWLPQSWSDPSITCLDLLGPYWNDMAIDSQDNLHVVTSGRLRDGNPGSVFYLRSSDGGQTWTEPLPLFDTSYSVTHIRLAADAHDIIHLVWTDADVKTGDSGIRSFYMHSLDGGYTWSEPATVGYEGSNWLDVAVDRNNVIHLTWTGIDYRFWVYALAYHQWSSDGGASWSRPLPISGGLVEGLFTAGQGWADMAFDSDGNLHVAATHSGELYHNCWDGRSWALPSKIPTGAFAFRPRIATSEGNRLHVVWYETVSEDEASGNSEIYYSTALLGAPPIARQALPTPKAARPTRTPTPQPAATASPPSAATSISTSLSTATPLGTQSPQAVPTFSAPMGPVPTEDRGPIVFAVVAVVILVGAVVLVKSLTAGGERWRRFWRRW